MSCIAIWFHQRNKNAESALSSAEAHFNLWRLRNSKSHKTEPFIDIGLMINEPQNIASLLVYVPFAVSEKIQDLGRKLGNTSTLQAVFNEPWRSLVDPELNTIDVVDFEKKKLFQIYRIREDDCIIEPAYDGSILRLDIPDDIRTKTYLRFRIHANNFSPVMKEDKPTNSWLESAFYVTETIDLHVNEKRNLPEELLKTVHAEGEIGFTKTHLFLMRYDNFDHVFSYPAPIDSRTLEPMLWMDYLGPEYISDRVIAYHWKQKSETTASDGSVWQRLFKSFNVFTKFRYQKASVITVIIFIVILLAISIVGSLIATWLFKLVVP